MLLNLIVFQLSDWNFLVFYCHKLLTCIIYFSIFFFKTISTYLRFECKMKNDLFFCFWFILNFPLLLKLTKTISLLLNYITESIFHIIRSLYNTVFCLLHNNIHLNYKTGCVWKKVKWKNVRFMEKGQVEWRCSILCRFEICWNCFVSNVTFFLWSKIYRFRIG